MAIKVDGKPLTRECNLFGDSVALMKSLGQTTGEWNEKQLKLYLKLMCEELGETITAAFPGVGLTAKALCDQLQALIARGHLLGPNMTELFDGIIDVRVVTTGAGTSTGFPMAEVWAEVFRSNMAKVDPATGQVTRRPDGKVLKPEGWQPPDLESILVARGIVEATPEEEPVSDDVAEPGFVEDQNDDASQAALG